MYTYIVLFCFPGAILQFAKDWVFHICTIFPISPTTIEINYVIRKSYGFTIVLLAERGLCTKELCSTTQIEYTLNQIRSLELS